MNEYYSENTPPSEVEVIRYLIHETKRKHPSLNEDDIIQCVKKSFDDFGGIKEIGSLTGWLLISKNKLLHTISKRLNMNIELFT